MEATRLAETTTTKATTTLPTNAINWMRNNPLEAIVAMLLCVLFCYAFWDTSLALATRWNQDANYGHGYMVPLVSVYLALHNRDVPARTGRQRGLVTGVLLVMAGMALRCLCMIVASLVGECISMLLVLAGLTLICGGWPLFRRMLVPIAFLGFMVPWPSALYSAVAFPLQLFVSDVSAVILQLVGIPILHEGNLIHLPGQTMHVAEACSGLRQLTAFLAISTCAALLMDRPRWYRLLLFVSAVPIAVAVNAFRVTGTGLCMHFGNPAWTEGWLHTAEGLITVGLGLLLMMLEVRLVDWLLVEDVSIPHGASTTKTLDSVPAAA